MTTSKEYCPVCEKEMALVLTDKSMTFRGIEIIYKDCAYICSVCGMEIATTKQAAEIQKNISESYRKAVGLLTGAEIRKYRKKLGLTQKALADKMTVGIASIKRWEGGIIQSKPMDKVLRTTFWNSERENSYTGNRDFSIPRVKLVVKYFESLLKRRLLVKGDKLLFTAKYLWYADFVAHRELERSMTGAAYAALPFGPQFNNFKELITPIKEADENEAEPLNSEEKNILKRITKAFPTPQAVYDAAHKEPVWKNKRLGVSILYSESSYLTQI